MPDLFGRRRRAIEINVFSLHAEKQTSYLGGKLHGQRGTDIQLLAGAPAKTSPARRFEASCPGSERTRYLGLG